MLWQRLLFAFCTVACLSRAIDFTPLFCVLISLSLFSSLSRAEHELVHKFIGKKTFNAHQLYDIFIIFTNFHRIYGPDCFFLAFCIGALANLIAYHAQTIVYCRDTFFMLYQHACFDGFWFHFRLQMQYLPPSLYSMCLLTTCMFGGYFLSVFFFFGY